ncbi:MAG: protein phosphatase 2C domain-containing protein [Pseudomonadota bacterium]|nr:protein phosphatase 2C domain-containing protein [Pseudomonadota bacterium]
MTLASGNSHGFEIAGAMLTDVGRVRSSNEDAVAFVIPTRNDPAASRGCLLLVADGMGGHAAGEVASALAVEAVRRVYFSLQEPVPESLMIAFETANRAILEQGKNNPDCRGMGTTCTALAIHDGQVWLAHVGDSRAYLLRKGKLTQLSDDQTLHARMIREGLMTEEESKTSGGGNVVWQALGMSADVLPAVWEKGIPLIEGDTLVLCSDGLWNMVDDAAIAEIAARAAPQEACLHLIGAALEAGGYDNVSVGIFALRPPAGPRAEAPAATRRIDIAGLEVAEAAATRMIALPEGPP